jgi:hypothetical protein
MSEKPKPLCLRCKKKVDYETSVYRFKGKPSHVDRKCSECGCPIILFEENLETALNRKVKEIKAPLKKMTVRELKSWASSEKIKGRSGMNKNELVDAIASKWKIKLPYELCEKCTKVLCTPEGKKLYAMSARSYLSSLDDEIVSCSIFTREGETIE